MSEQLLGESTTNLSVAATEEPKPSIPPWFGEAILMAQLWRDSGWLDNLQHSVRMVRGRMGNYETCDFNSSASMRRHHGDTGDIARE